ncbi:M4 family metallopeptidase [Roseateles puraquae]|uniref:M4 family metallopeptidase n=1 Tax=Roseateles puraquae TaxID=431059 RepID=UPI0019D4229E|nr:M4 family metallopeptidase [Roseateles puraquae]
MFRTSHKLSLLVLAALSCAAQAQSAPGASEAARATQARASAQSYVRQFPGLSLDNADHSYEVRDIVLDEDGSSHVRLDRRIGGLRAIGADLVVQSDRFGNLTAMHRSASMLSTAAIPTKATFNQTRAMRIVSDAFPGGTVEKNPEQVIWAREDQPRLAWEVRVSGDGADGTPYEKHVIIDATTGRQIDAWDDIHTAAANGTGRTLYSGNVTLTTNSLTSGYELRDPSRGNNYTINMANRTSGGSVVTDADNTWGNNATSDAVSAAADAQYGTAVTWDYYKNVHGRTGIANNGTGAYNRVHYSSRYNNAYWSDSCFCMTYGDGDGTTFRPLVSLDVAGHEMTHGVTSRTARLIYSGESGGLNEATSDIFGTMVEFYANNANDAGDYLIGEKIRVGGGSLRNMIKPSSDGASADCWYSGVGNLDVHYSSGVANHFFFLLAEGTNSSYGTSPTCVAGNTRVATGSGSLTGIGRTAAAKIWYRALTTKFTSSTTYAQARAGTIAAAQELAATLGADYSAKVAAAWSAVGRN